MTVIFDRNPFSYPIPEDSPLLPADNSWIGEQSFTGNVRTPTSSADTGTPGQIVWDTNYIYVCTATNTWKRVLLSAF